MQWAQRIPKIYRTALLKEETSENVSVEEDENCLGLLKHYRSLIPMAMEVNKPIFSLKPADGAIGAHLEAVRKSYEDFKQLTERILKRVIEKSLLSQ